MDHHDLAAEITLQGTMEPFLILSVLSMILYGVLLMQIFNYYSSYQDDLKALRVAVAVILVLETLQQALILHSLWYYLVHLGAEDITAGTAVNWSFVGRLVPTELGTLIVEFLFVARIWILGDRKKPYLLLFVPAVVAFGFGIALIVHFFQRPAFGDAPSSRWFIIAWAATRTLADLSIAATKCWKLNRSRRDLSAEIQSVLWSIFSFALTTGILTSVFALLIIITYLVLPFDFVYAGIYTIYGKIYANSLLASLNTRQALRARAHHTVNLSSFRVNDDSPTTTANTGLVSSLSRLVTSIGREWEDVPVGKEKCDEAESPT
ncbi:hypothetical protein PENSPDRAFT_755014 [Peniophora sp. CONT]|nr:hypothetical protein PENSPDRAFT_755014 [Peniophora sp. CONT]